MYLGYTSPTRFPASCFPRTLLYEEIISGAYPGVRHRSASKLSSCSYEWEPFRIGGEQNAGNLCTNTCKTDVGEEVDAVFVYILLVKLILNVNMSFANTGPALCSLDDFVSDSYDYVVIGGGTAGLVVAARLTENPSVKVGVIEAGRNRMDDKQISTPSLYPTMIGCPEYDWCMSSIPQPNAGNKSYSMPRGKVLGGSSAINYLMYVRGSRKDYDSWVELGNKGWGWDDLVPYFKKHQMLDVPDAGALPEDKQFMPHAEKDKYHGKDGPIHTSFNDHYTPVEEDFCKAAYDIGGKPNTLSDAWSGDHMGFYSSLAAVDRSSDPGNRSYAATGYLRPNLNRENLRVLTEAHATRILMDKDRAVGVEFSHSGKLHRVQAKKEVVLSSGVIQTPQLLELSGIGDPDVLQTAGVQCIVENKSVGANFQDHVLGGMLFDLKEGVIGMDALQDEDYAKAQQEIYDKTHTGLYGSPGMLMGFVSYSSLVDKRGVDKITEEIRCNSLAKTDFEKAQEKVQSPRLFFSLGNLSNCRRLLWIN